jgi:hypothetical protein
MIVSPSVKKNSVVVGDGAVVEDGENEDVGEGECEAECEVDRESGDSDDDDDDDDNDEDSDVTKEDGAAQIDVWWRSLVDQVVKGLDDVLVVDRTKLEVLVCRATLGSGIEVEDTRVRAEVEVEIILELDGRVCCDEVTGIATVVGISNLPVVWLCLSTDVGRTMAAIVLLIIDSTVFDVVRFRVEEADDVLDEDDADEVLMSYDEDPRNEAVWLPTIERSEEVAFEVMLIRV